jgi:HK97 family phage portal protein
MSTEERVVSDLVWTPERGSEQPEVRGISWENFLLSDDKYLGKWKTDSGIRITPETALQSTIVLACCRILAETVSGLPLHVYRRSPDGGDEIAKEIPLYKVLTFRPNDWQTKQEFFEQIVMTLALWGNSYTRIRSGQYGSVSCLDNLHPSRMEVERLENGRLRYSYTDPETGRLERYTQDQIMHCRWTPEQDGIKGMVPVEIAREAIGLARACEQHAARFWANSARPGVVLQTEGTLNAEAAERLRDNWERLHRGSERAFRTAVLTGGMKAVELGMTNESSQFVASRDFQTAEICRVYRIPQHLIQGTPGGDLEVQGQEFVTYTLMPWLNRIESSISRSLIYNDDEYYAKFDVRGLLRANSNQRASYYSTMIGLGIFSINDCRKAEGMKSLGPDGDHHFVAMNTQTLEEAVKPKPEGGMPGGGGPPPPTPGGPPSLPEVKTGKAPIESPKGEASTPKAEPEMEEAVEEASADWEDAIEGRAFCATGEGQGTDNSCSSSGGKGAAKVDNSWKKADREYSYRPGDGNSPIVGGDNIKSLSIEKPADLAATMKDLKVKSLTDVVTIGGGLTRGSFTSIVANGNEIHVMSEVPVNPDQEESAGMSSTVTLGVDNEGKKFVDYGTMSAASDAGTANLTGEDAARMSSILLEKFPESLAAAEKAGFSYAKTFAMGSSEDEFKGYRLWPQFGFDAEIYPDIRENIPKDIVPHDDPVTIQELISTPAGDKWWNENGESMAMTLNLKDKKSDGYRRYQRMSKLSQRLKKRNEGRSLFDVLFPEYRAFCSTGPGGGIDNSCGAKTMNSPDKDSGGGSVSKSKFPVADSMPQSVSVEQAKESMKEYVGFSPSVGTNNSDFAVPPSDEDLAEAIRISNKGKVPKIGKAMELPEGTPVAIRIDIPAFTRSTEQMGKSVYAVTVHEDKGGDGFGSPIGYETMARLSGKVRFSSKETEAIRVATGETTKTPLATVKGSLSKSREIPSDIDSWTPVGFDPKKAAYFYNKRTGQELIGGTDSLSVGNTVFTRIPEYGPRNAKTHYRSASEMFATGSWGLESRGFCPTGEGGGIENTCSSQDGSKAGPDADKTTSGSGGSCPAPCPTIDVTSDKNKDGVTDAARVGVPAMEVPPPPNVSRVPNLTPHERSVEDAFMKHFQSDPDGVSSQFLELVKGMGDPPTFGTDDAKCLTDAWSHPDPDTRAQNRATLNVALHQTANAIAKRAFVQHLDTLSKGDEILVTVGGCGAGKGFALKNNPDALAMKSKAAAVWDSAGDQNATENPWVLKEAEERGLKVNFVFVHADPKVQWADPDRGVVKRAADPKDGRMVDAMVFADSYAIGAKNHHAFHQANKDNPSASFVFLDNTGKPKQIPGVPKEALELDSSSLAEFAQSKVKESSAPERVKSGALVGTRIWKRKGK